MSCCPSSTPVNVGGDAHTDNLGTDPGIAPGETVECYMNKAGNPTGRMDDGTEHPKNKISNSDIPLTAEAAVDVTFKLTPDSTKTAVAWEIKNFDGTAVSMPGVTFNGTAGTLKGTFTSADFGKQFKVRVFAYERPDPQSLVEIDSRGYSFSPAKANGMNEISFLHPLPGAVVTSKYGPRIHPVTGVNKPHRGADFALPGRKIGDILAAADGTCIFTGFENGGAGNYVKIEHKNSAGKVMCTTVYMHLNQIYVKQGQQVMAGQKIGLEGNTGIGTGAHLHFECRLPNGTWMDPVPLIKGSLPVSQKTNPDNTAVPSSVETQDSKAVLTPENVDAKQAGCEAPGPGYGGKQPDAQDPIPPTGAPVGDAFEKIWFYTMKHEVGPRWAANSPEDPEIAAGLIQTSEQRKKVGYVNDPVDRGGITKFGVAQKSNPQVVVNDIDYAKAKSIGFNNYWKPVAAGKATAQPKVAMMLFDMTYLHGAGGAKNIATKAGAEGKPDAEAIELLCQSQQNYMNNIVANNPKMSRFINGWLKRAKELLAYVKSV